MKKIERFVIVKFLGVSLLGLISSSGLRAENCETNSPTTNIVRFAAVDLQITGREVEELLKKDPEKVFSATEWASLKQRIQRHLPSIEVEELKASLESHSKGAEKFLKDRYTTMIQIISDVQESRQKLLKSAGLSGSTGGWRFRAKH